jgi:hypothetical protein
MGRTGLNRRRILAAAFFSLVILAVLGVIVGAEIASGGQTVSVLRLRADVERGAVFSASDVDVVPLRISPGDINYEAPGSVPAGSRYALSLRAGDLLSPDDIEQVGAQIEITLTITNPPPIQPGEAIDVFASVGQSQLLIGHAVPVVGVSGSELTVLVGSQDEMAWVEIAASNTSLHAVVAVTTSPAGLAPDGVEQAICQLAPEECLSPGGLPSSGSPAAAAVTPASTPSSTPTP